MRLRTRPRQDDPSEDDSIPVDSDTEAVTAAPAVGSDMPPGTGRKARFSFRTFDSLSVPAFRWFFISMFGWFASMNMQMLVRGLLTFDLTGSYASLGLVFLANSIPGMILSLPGGVLADRLNKKKVIQTGQVANMAVSAFIAFLIFSGELSFVWLLISAVLQGTINSLIMPARQSMIADIVSEDRLMNAVALNTAGMNVMRMAAPAAAGVIYEVAGAEWVYALMSVLYFSGALLLFPVKARAQVVPSRRPEAARAASVEKDGVSEGGALPRNGPKAGGHRGRRAAGPRELAEGLSYVRRDRVIFTILAVNFIIVLLSMPFQHMLPGFIEDVLGQGGVRLGILMTLVGVGSLVGSLVIASLPPRKRGLILLISSAVMGGFLILFAISTSYWITAAIMVGIGLGQAGRMSLTNVMLMAYTDPAYRGRVMSINMMEFSLMSFGTYAVGVFANAVGIQVAIGIIAASLVVVVLATLAFVPRLRNLD